MLLTQAQDQEHTMQEIHLVRVPSNSHSHHRQVKRVIEFVRRVLGLDITIQSALTMLPGSDTKKFISPNNVAEVIYTEDKAKFQKRHHSPPCQDSIHTLTSETHQCTQLENQDQQIQIMAYLDQENMRLIHRLLSHAQELLIWMIETRIFNAILK